MLLATMGLGGCAADKSTALSASIPQRDARNGAEKSPPVRLHNESGQEEDDTLPVLDESAGLSDFLQYAALNNPGLEAAFNRWKAAVERVPQVEALPDPRFNYRYFIEEVETRVGPQTQAFGLAQTFPWFGKLKTRGDAAADAAEAVRQRYEAEKLRLFFEVKDAYYEFYYLGRAIDVVQQNLELLRYLESVARARYKTATAGHPEVIRAQVELGKLDDQHRALLDLQRPVIARLNTALNRPSDAPLPPPSTIPCETLTAGDDELMAWMRSSNPQLQALAHEIDKTQHDIELARLEYFPDVTLGVDYTDVGQPPRAKAQGFANPAVLRSISRITGGMGDLIDVYGTARGFRPGDPPNDAGKDIWMVSLSMNVPIWWGKYAAGEREARARYLAAAGDRAQQENSLAESVERALYGYRDAERKIDLYGNTLIPKARQSLRATEAAFRAGNSTFLDLVDSERSLLEFELQYERALANRAQRLAELEKLVGRELPTAPAQDPALRSEDEATPSST